jgi:putative membrane protein
LRDRWVRAFLSLVVFSLLGSLFTRLSGLNPGPIAPVTSVLTIACGVVATFSSYWGTAKNAWVRLLLALAIGAGSELVGLATGLPFGRYSYTAQWWPTAILPIGRFPLMLPFAWLLMAGASAFVAARWSRGAMWGAMVLGGLLAATVDLAMEPVMAGLLGYWRWHETGPLPGGVPAQNFFGWWATASLAGGVLLAGVPLTEDRRAGWVLGGFVLLVLGLGLVR